VVAALALVVAIVVVALVVRPCWLAIICSVPHSNQCPTTLGSLLLRVARRKAPQTVRTTFRISTTVANGICSFFLQNDVVGVIDVIDVIGVSGVSGVSGVIGIVVVVADLAQPCLTTFAVPQVSSCTILARATLLVGTIWTTWGTRGGV
jgi:hypothetical protein